MCLKAKTKVLRHAADQRRAGPQPSAFDPLNGISGPGEPRGCYSHPPKGQLPAPIDYRHVFVTFYLQHQPDHVAVYVVDNAGNVIDTITSNYDFRRTKVRNPPGAFVWDGHDQNTGGPAPDGTYYYRIVFLGQDRTIQIVKPITLTSIPPRPRVTKVSPSLISPAGSPPRTTISYTGTAGALRAYVRVIRTDLPGGPRVAYSFKVPPDRHTAVWNGLIRGTPAPAGSYLIGLQVIDAACHVANFPAELPVNGIPPTPTPHAGVTVRYLAAQVPNTPVAPGQDATVYVDSRRHAYSWKLFRAGLTRVLGAGTSTSYALKVPLPDTGAGLYGLSISYPGQHTVVPLVASSVLGAAPRAVLVVLPMLTWQGLNPVDDNGDGQPNTLLAGGPIALSRPFVAGLPSDFADVEAFLTELNHAGFHYDLTTDLALLGDPSSVLHRYRGVVFPGSEMWLPESLGTALKSFVSAGGHVLAIGTGSLTRTVVIKGSEALDPSAPSAVDAFGARHGAIVTANKSLAFKFHDPLGLFSTGSGAFSGLSTFQVIQPPADTVASTAGIAQPQPAITGFELGHGVVVELGLDDYGVRLKTDADFRGLLARTWRLLGS